MMRPRLRTYVALLLFCGWLLSGCSTTKNLPEGEVLYTGIKEIDYGQKSKKKKKKQKEQATQEGVITSFADAYKAVDELLTQRDLSALKRPVELTDEQKDSIEEVRRIEEDGLLIEHDIGVVADSALDRVDILEEGKASVACSHVDHIFGDVPCIMHCDNLLRRNIYDGGIISNKLGEESREMRDKILYDDIGGVDAQVV